MSIELGVKDILVKPSNRQQVLNKVVNLTDLDPDNLKPIHPADPLHPSKKNTSSLI